MSSPTKKRKLNNATKPEKTQSKGLEYFFSKQKQNGGSSSGAPESSPADADSTALTDEELARKLQAEWDKEDAQTSVREDEAKETPAEAERSETAEPVISAEPASGPPNLQTAAFFGGKKTLALQSAGMDEDKVTVSIPLDEPPLTFEPSKYIDQLKEHWAKDGGNASYALLTRCFVLVSGTTSRIKIVDTLVNCLRILIEGDPESLLPAVRLATTVLCRMY